MNPTYLALCVIALVAPLRAAPPAPSVAHELDAEFSYVGEAATRSGGRVSWIDATSASVQYVVSPQLTKRLLLRVGAEWQRFSFGVPTGPPLPDVLQQISAIIGFDYQLNDQWLLRAELQPGVYSDFKDVSARDVNAPLVLGAVYVVDADLQWVLGLRVDVRSQFPVLPAIGVRWRFADEWTLNLLMPRPRLEYEINERLTAYVGAVIKAGTYKVGARFGTDHGRPNLNHATLSYLEARLGPGLAWKVRPNVTLEINTGYMVYRQFDYFDEDLTLQSAPAPYGQIAGRVRF